MSANFAAEVGACVEDCDQSFFLVVEGDVFDAIGGVLRSFSFLACSLRLLVVELGGVGLALLADGRVLFGRGVGVLGGCSLSVGGSFVCLGLRSGRDVAVSLGESGASFWLCHCGRVCYVSGRSGGECGVEDEELGTGTGDLFRSLGSNHAIRGCGGDATLCLLPPCANRRRYVISS